MANGNDVRRADEGADVWNAWARAQIEAGNSPEADFSNIDLGSTSFSKFIFPGTLNCRGAVFSGPVVFFTETEFLQGADFSGARFTSETTFDDLRFPKFADFSFCTFEKNAYFNKVTFDYANFYSAEFKGNASFHQARFSNVAEFQAVAFAREASFSLASFESTVTFDGAQFAGRRNEFSYSQFARVPDLRAARFAHPPTMHNMNVSYAVSAPQHGRIQHFLRRAIDYTDAACFRRLKQLAADTKDHERELQFFANELRAKRFFETTSIPQIALSLAYDWLSDYGRSVARPALWLAALTFLSWITILVTHTSSLREALSKSLAALVLAFTNASLLAGADKWMVRTQAFDLLCGPCKPQFGLTGDLASYLQSGVSLLLLFLLGVGLRNRFRLGNTS